MYFGARVFYRQLDLGWPPLNVATVTCNALLCCSLASDHWINGVYWTLEVELCFYITFSTLYFLCRGDSGKLLPLFFAMGAISFLAGFEHGFPEYMLVFLIGAILADARDRTVPSRWTIPLLLGTFALVLADNGPRTFAFAAFAALCIQLFQRTRGNAPALFLGRISYSLYLTHTLLAFLAESVLKRVTSLHEGPAGKVALLLIYAGLAVAWAYPFFLLVENPVVRRVRSIR